MTAPRPWFKAKTRGWGWGAATTWQGWSVYAAYIALVAGGAAWLPASQHPVAFLCGTSALTALLVGICWLTGERPRWRGANR
jgi:hypothetical protein